MKKLFTLFVTVFFTVVLFAQSPQKMSYQAVIRNSTDQLVTNHAEGMRVSILQGSLTGTPVYVETQTTSTNANGLVTIEIGGGAVISGDFTTIDWSTGVYFIKTETDPTGGTSYTITGTSQLLSVPYALYAKTAENGFSGNYIDLTNKPTLFDGNYNSLLNTPTLFNGQYSSLTGIPTFASVATSGSYNNLIDKPTLFDGQYNSLTGKPTTISGYGITDAMTTALAANGITAIDIINWTTAYSWGNHALAGYLTSFTEIDPTFTTNFDFTGAITNDLLQFNGTKWVKFTPDFSLTNHTHADATTSVSGFMSGVDKTKLDGLQNADGSETKITAGGNTSVTGNGTIATPYVVGAKPHIIGENLGGGRVFFVYDNGQHGLIAAGNDLGMFPWSNFAVSTSIYVGATSDGLGSGQMNTAIIISAETPPSVPFGSFAARRCTEYFLIGTDGVKYGGWYLPSMYELNLLYLQKNIIGGFQYAFYWSSNTDLSNPSLAWGIDFSIGAQSSYNKSQTWFVRPIRAF